MEKFGFPQPPYDRFYSWITGMLVMLTELENQEYMESRRSVHALIKGRINDGQSPLAVLKIVFESSLLSPGGKWTSLCGKFEMMLDVMTPLMKAEPNSINHLIYKFETQPPHHIRLRCSATFSCACRASNHG